jgi:hypothetical protein
MQAFYLSRLPAIRAAAKEHGYAIGLHGSMRRDFDLMAMQWCDDAADKDTLARAVADAACGIRREGAYDWERKPNGRFATSIPICWTDHENPEFDNMLSLGHVDLSVITQQAAPESPIPMILHCPRCGLQHIDAPDERTEGWVNPPHRSHLCHGCGNIWRPADVPTEGVTAIQTRGANDSAPAQQAAPDSVPISPMFLASAAYCIENYNTVAPKTRQAMIDKLLDVSKRLQAEQRAALTRARSAPEGAAS